MKSSFKKSWLFYLLALLPIALMLIPDLAFAAPNYFPTNGDCTPWPFCLWLNVLSFTPPPTDLSVLLLSEVFGRIPNVLNGPSSTIIGNMFGIFNNGIGGLIGVVVIYTTGRAIFDTAADGEPMGKKISHWSIVRTVAGMSLIVPNYTGYSIIQIIIMWVTLQGIGLADSVWSGTMDYLQRGNPFYLSIAQNANTPGGADGQVQIDPAIVTGNTAAGFKEDNNSNHVGSSGILRSLVCVEALNKSIYDQTQLAKRRLVLEKDKLQSNPTLMKSLTALANSYTVLSPSYDRDNKVVYFPGKYSEDKVGTLDLSNVQGICGTYRWGWNRAANESNMEWTQDATYMNQKLSGLQSIVNYLTPLAHEMIADPKSEYYTNTDIATRTLNAAVVYQADLQDIRREAGPNKDYASHAMMKEIVSAKDAKSIKTPDEQLDEAFDQAKQEGWAAAGRFYYIISKARDLLLHPLESNFYLIQSKGEYPKTDDQTGALINAPFRNATTKNFLNNSKLDDFFDSTTQDPTTKGILLDQLDKISITTASALGLAQALEQNDPLKNMDNMAGSETLSSFITTLTSINPYQLPTPFGITLPTFKTGGSSRCLIPRFKFLFGSHLGGWICFNASKGDPLTTMNFDPAMLIFSPAVFGTWNVLKDWDSIMLNNCLTNAGTNKTGTVCKRASSATIALPTPIEKLKKLGDTMVYNSLNAFLQIAKNIRNVFLTLVEAYLVGAAVGSGLSIIPYIGTVGLALLRIMGFLFDKTIMYLILSSAVLSPIVVAILTPMFATGITLSMYIPLIPFLLFTFGVISWLMFVIEAMAAAPLVALGITHPHGHDFLGKADQSIMLTFAVFLRPVSMIIGLIAAMVLSYVAVDLINATFMGILTDVGFFKPALAFLHPSTGFIDAARNVATHHQFSWNSGAYHSAGQHFSQAGQHFNHIGGDFSNSAAGRGASGAYNRYHPGWSGSTGGPWASQYGSGIGAGAAGYLGGLSWGAQGSHAGAAAGGYIGGQIGGGIARGGSAAAGGIYGGGAGVVGGTGGAFSGTGGAISRGWQSGSNWGAPGGYIGQGVGGIGGAIGNAAQQFGANTGIIGGGVDIEQGVAGGAIGAWDGAKATGQNIAHNAQVIGAYFNAVTQSIMGNSFGINQILAIVKYSFAMVIYTTLMMSVVNQTFSLIYIIPDKIGRWIGLREGAADSSKYLEQVKGGINELSGTMSKVGSAAIEKTSGQIKQPESYGDKFKGGRNARWAKDKARWGKKGTKTGRGI